MMTTRNVNQLPTHGAPSRDDFAKLDERQRVQINDVFSVFDVNKDGRLDYHELRFCLRALGFELPKAETYPYLVRYGIQPIDWDPKRECTPVWREFTLPIWQGIAGTLMYNRDPVEECHRAFKLFDVDGKGVITLEDLRRTMREIGQSMEEQELQSMIKEFDSEGKGGVNVDEFTKIMMTRKQK
ncbi:Calcium-binding component of the spindle pole body (SPB) half-bridge [Gnomoniopsis sp. IMI 355080]|uniref:Calmodulin n=1 Tax=Gnomoniopsis smithogilvyi TaxID=1191159 RepID=A0A9W9CYQ9_9PEZI|nr:Calcium-binding component of the spindle pole body (SPB) half-bridge [Gnomoniopsis smithogilvyi]KAJ4424947.1 Calcium-binding component of the spindle pole body (SPB) half-bridge [Gnomoniopsis sp. IMI 355080]